MLSTRRLDRGRDDHLPDAVVEVRLEQLGGLELAGALEDDVDLGGLPRNVGTGGLDRRVPTATR
jgi:hypothetical protein